MRRAYSIDEYRDKVRKLRARAPGIAMSTDVIVGFPGETEAEYEDTLKLLAEIRYDAIYAFKYSERPGTRASKLGDTVSESDKERRLAGVLDLQHQITRERMQAYVGQRLEILVEGASQRTAKGGGGAATGMSQVMGRTRTNVIVNVPVPLGELWTRRWVGKLAMVDIVDAKANSLFGHFA